MGMGVLYPYGYQVGPGVRVSASVMVTVGLAVLVGICLGLLGGGGAILTVPLLAYVAGLEPQQAIATSLLVVGVTSAVGAIAHARAGRVRWRVAALFGAAAMAGAYGGGRLAAFVPGSVLLIGFAVLMIAAALAMLRGRRDDADSGPAEQSVARLPVAKIVAQGAAVGVISGLVGAGGGFLLVPALALLGGLPMPAAIGTSLVVISLQSFAGLAGHLAGASIDWRLAALVTAAAVVGAVIGSVLSGHVAPAVLRKAFGWFVLAMAAVVLAEETDLRIGLAVGALTAVAGGVVLRRGAIPPRVRLS